MAKVTSILHDPQGHRHVIHYIPEIAAEALLEVLRKISERLSDVVVDLLDPEIRSNSVGRWWFKILKGILSDVPDVGRIPKSPARSVVRDNHSHLAPWPANTVHFLHEMYQPPNVLDDVTEVNEINGIRLERQRQMTLTPGLCRRSNPKAPTILFCPQPRSTMTRLIRFGDKCQESIRLFARRCDT